jgi:dephospho-CoA kinase
MRKSNYPFVVKEAALVFESDSYKSLDFIVCMVAPLETRIERVIKRDGKLRKEVLDIINRQWTDDEKIKRSAWVIKNTDDDLLLPQIVALHELIVSKTEFYGN